MFTQLLLIKKHFFFSSSSGQNNVDKCQKIILLSISSNINKIKLKIFYVILSSYRTKKNY